MKRNEVFSIPVRHPFEHHGGC